MSSAAQGKSAKQHKPKRPRQQKGTTHLAFLLDRSGSMGVVLDATISGFNEYIQDRKTEEGVNYRFYLTMFNTLVERRYDGVPMVEVNPLNRFNYVPSGGTALYDAILHTLTDISTRVQPGDRVLFVMMTDGQENSSREANRSQVRNLISQKEALGNWTFVYLGANQDAWQVGFGLGISHRENTLTYGHSYAGTASAMQSLSRSTAVYAAGASKSMENFFTQADQDEQNNLGAVAPSVTNITTGTAPDFDVNANIAEDLAQKLGQSAKASNVRSRKLVAC
jgi:hypothetical protein